MATMEKYWGNYLGIVLQNNDPEKRGRVKVFVPHVSYSSYENWSQVEADKLFTNLQDPDLSNVLKDLKTVLPWAEVAGPLFGGNASGRYNASKKSATTSNSNVWQQDSLVLGNRPAAAFTGAEGMHDAFQDANVTGVMNPYTYEYTPSDYSNLAAGTFTVPNVGAHVWVFFQAGDHNAPVYWATSYSQADYKRIYTTVKFTDESLAPLGTDALNRANVSVDYPDDYENTENPQLTPELKTFRAKHVINTNKHTIELVDTDNREILKLTHFSGSFKEWNNFATIEFASNNDQKLVLGDQFETIRRNKNVYINQQNRLFVEGDSYLRVGNYDIKKVQQAWDLISSINEYKGLFDARRIGKLVYKQRSGGFFPLELVTGVTGLSPYQAQQEALFTGKKTYPDTSYYNGFTRCPICRAKSYKVGVAGWSLGINAEPVPGAVNPTLIATVSDPAASEFYQDLKKLETKKMFTKTTATTDPTEPGVGFYAGAKCDVCSSDYMKEALRRVGYSPSTEYGLFKDEVLKQPGGAGLYSAYSASRQKLNELLATFSGGDYIAEIHKNKIETIGLVMNTSQSYRVDPIGKLRAESVFVAPEQVYTAGKPSPQVESVDVSEVPGGNYIVTAANKLKFIVGAKGVNIKTFGPLDMYGTIVNFTGELVNISSQNEINIDAGEKLFIRSRKVTIANKDHEPVLIESPLHVSRNTIIHGGLYIDGEVGLRHVTTVKEKGVTSPPTGSAAAAAATSGITVTGTNISSTFKQKEKFEAGIQAAGGTVYSPQNPGSFPQGAFRQGPGGGGFYTTRFEVPLEAIGDPKLGVTWNEVTKKSIASALAAIASKLAFLMAHVHLYDRIPTKFLDSVEEVRGFLNDPSEFPNGGTINGRNVMLAAKPTTPFSGEFSGIVGATLSSKNFDAIINAAVIAGYAPYIINGYSIVPAGSFFLKAGASSSPDSNNIITAIVSKNYAVKGPVTGTLELTFTVKIPVIKESSQGVDGNNVSGTNAYRYDTSKKVTVTYSYKTGTPPAPVGLSTIQL